MDDEDIRKSFNELNNRIDSLYKIVEKESNAIEKETTTIEKEEIKFEKTLDILSKKFDEIIKLFKEKKEYVEIKIKESPIAYVTGTLVGGLMIGYLISKGSEKNKK